MSKCRGRLESIAETQDQWRAKERQALGAILAAAKKGSVTAENFEKVDAAQQSATRGTVIHGDKVVLSGESEPLVQQSQTWLQENDVNEPAAVVAWAKATLSANRSDLLRMKPMIDEAGAMKPQDLVDLFESGDEGKALIARLVAALPLVKGWKLMDGLREVSVTS